MPGQPMSSPRTLMPSAAGGHPSNSASSSAAHSPSGSHAITMPSTSPTAHAGLGPHPSILGGGGRSFNPNEPSQRERQKQQDIDSAIGFTRARSASITAGFSPPLSPRDPVGSSHMSPDVLRRPSAPPRLSHHSSHDQGSSTPQFPMLSESEEAHMSLARGGGGRGAAAGYGTDEEVILEDNEDEASFTLGGGGRHSPEFTHGSPREHHHRQHSAEPSRSYEDEPPMGGPLRASPGMMLGGGGGGPGGESSRAGSVRRMDLGGFATRNRFHFNLLEDFAQVEKITLGAADMTPRYEHPGVASTWTEEPVAQESAKLVDDRASIDIQRSSTGGFEDGPADDETELRSAAGVSQSNGDGSTGPGAQDGGPRTNFVRRRQRKLSQSNPAPHARRQAKVALFEGGGNATAPSSFPFKTSASPSSAPLMPATVRDSKSSLYDTFSGPPPPSGLQPPLIQPNLQDRPYRFSFYSNALPSTIHARSLSELPAEGQTFEDLFSGRSADDDDSLTKDDGSPQHPATARTSGTATPRSYDGSSVAGGNAGKESLLSKAIGMSKMPGGGGANGIASAVERERADPESTTWWLDVLCPTDDEMKTLSKVFGIHPLTTEDIQMEEAREKIELFRNYYLVCFRSFDQDPYSPTHLEPLNMYIIVFREGTLSFHFRGTPHPQNVRRRIKQLKDYISVTSDWISYALIDDIADAFGPLVQSIEYEVDSIDELVLILKEAEQSDMLRRIGTCRKKVMGLLRLMGNKADVVKGLAKRCNESWSVAPKSDIGLYLSDIQDHLITMTQNLNHYEKILSRSHSNYLAQISIDMTDANNQMNEVLSRMTALGTVLIPMNLVTGLWGMNVWVPGQDQEGNLTWFFSIVGCLIAFAIFGAFATYRFLKL